MKQDLKLKDAKSPYCIMELPFYNGKKAGMARIAYKFRNYSDAYHKCKEKRINLSFIKKFDEAHDLVNLWNEQFLKNNFTLKEIL